MKHLPKGTYKTFVYHWDYDEISSDVRCWFYEDLWISFGDVIKFRKYIDRKIRKKKLERLSKLFKK